MTPPAQYLVLSHFEAMSVFAFFVSLVFALLSKDTRREQAIYFLRTFSLFFLTGLGLGWLMYFYP